MGQRCECQNQHRRRSADARRDPGGHRDRDGGEAHRAQVRGG